MASKTKQTWIIRDRKRRSNKVNLKQEQKRIAKNIKTLAKLAEG